MQQAPTYIKDYKPTNLFIQKTKKEIGEKFATRFAIFIQKIMVFYV
jgi:hypothetical protein